MRNFIARAAIIIPALTLSSFAHAQTQSSETQEQKGLPPTYCRCAATRPVNFSNIEKLLGVGLAKSAYGRMPLYFSKLSKLRFSSQMCSMMLHVGRSPQRSVAFHGAG